MTLGTPTQPARLVVIGSINQDYFTYVDEFPHPGQTVLAQRAAIGLGGKGANQAMAAAALGCPVLFVGAVGSDSAATAALEGLRAGGVDTTGILILTDVLTGAAYITVSGTGENTIVVSAAANAGLDARAAESRLEELGVTASDVLLCQGELSAAVVERVAATASRVGARFVLNLAPVIPLSRTVLTSAAVLIVNEGEAQDLAARLGVDDLASDLGIPLVVTLGSRGARLTDGAVTIEQAAPRPSEVVDTTGAGDAFVGALAAALVAGLDLETAVRAGVSAGTAAVEKTGTTTSYVTGITPAELAARAPHSFAAVTE